MGTAEQELRAELARIQQVLTDQQLVLQQQQSQIQALNTHVQSAETRAQNAEAERSLVIRALGSSDQSGGLIDTKGVGQPFRYSGKQDQDFAEWDHKMMTYLRAKYGASVEPVLKWASRQRLMISEKVDPSMLRRMIPWSAEFGEDADPADQVDNIRSMVDGIYTYLVSFTTGDANKVVRNSGTDGLEAWRRLHAEYDPSSSMRRVAILGLVQNPPKCRTVDELGGALEQWLSRKRQYEEFTDKDGAQCRVSEDSLMAALYRLMPESLEEAVMFRAEDYPSFSDLFDKLSSYASTKHSLYLSRREQSGSGGGASSSKKDPNAMDIGAVGKGKSAGKSKGDHLVCFNCGRPGHRKSECRNPQKGSEKGSDRMLNVKCWNCEGYGHYGKNCPSKSRGKGKGQGQGGDPKGKGKNKSKDGKGKNSSKGNNSASAVDEPQSEPGKELCFLDLNSCSSEDRPKYLVSDGNVDWVRVNYDSGAAATVIPSAMVASEIDLAESGSFTGANGSSIPKYCNVRLKMKDEAGYIRSMSATVADVHKPLGSAAEFSRSHDCLLWDDGGVLIPKGGQLSKELRKSYEQLVKRYGDGTELPIYREGQLYNMYLQRVAPAEQISACDKGGPETSGKTRHA